MQEYRSLTVVRPLSERRRHMVHEGESTETTRSGRRDHAVAGPRLPLHLYLIPELTLLRVPPVAEEEHVCFFWNATSSDTLFL